MRIATIAAITALLLSASGLHAADQTWGANNFTSWYTLTNWAGGAFPGLQGAAASNTDIATFTSAASNTSFGIAMGTSDSLNLGAISLDSSRATSTSIGNSSASGSGSLRLYGATINSIPNVIFRNAGTGNATLLLNRSGTSLMDVVLSNSTTNHISLDSSGHLSITSNILGSGRILSLDTSSSGELRLNGNNTYDGGTNISGSATGGRLRLESTAALPTAGGVAINTGGRLTFDVNGTYGGLAQGLILNPNQTNTSSLDMSTNTVVTWQGTVAINADTRIDANGAASGVLTLSGNASGSGKLIKHGAGSLVLSGTGNNLTGATQIANGALRVQSGSSLGTGPLILAQTSSTDTSVIFNNSAQTVAGLSSVWNQVSGTRTQAISLNGTALTVNQTVDGVYGTGAVSTLVSTISGTGSLTKGGSAALTLSSANTYTGGTTISGGKLLVNNTTGSGTGTGSVNVNSGGTLGGAGFISGAASINTGGTLSPGNSIGKLTFNGPGNNVTMEDGSEYRAQLAAPTTPGTTHDQIVVDGGSKVFTPGEATIRLIAVFGIVTGGTDTYKIVTATNGATIAEDSFFQNLDNTVMDNEATTYSQGPLSFTINYESNFIAVTFSAVPEPTLAGLGAISLLLFRRRR